MGFATDKPAGAGSKRKKKEARAPSVPKTVRFDEHVAQQYQKKARELAEKREAVARELAEKRQRLAALEGSTSRGHLRDKQLLAKRIADLAAQWEHVKSDALLDEFKAQVRPYVLAYEREQQLQAILRLRQPDTAATLIVEPTPAPAAATPPSSSSTFPTWEPTVAACQRQESQVFKDYLVGVGEAAPEVKVIHREICEECDECMVLEPRASVLTCPGCFNWRPYLDATSSHMAYGEEVEFNNFAYLRLNHFNERVTYSQAKETNQIPVPVIERVMRWLFENRLTKREEITLDHVYQAMKALQMRTYYKQCTQMWCRITGNPPLRMTPEHEERLRLMFKAVQRLWPKYKPENRKNMLSYSYLLNRFNALLGADEFLPLFRLLKGAKKLQRQDQIFAAICRDPELNWQVLPSRPT